MCLEDHKKGINVNDIYEICPKKFCFKTVKNFQLFIKRVTGRNITKLHISVRSVGWIHKELDLQPFIRLIVLQENDIFQWWRKNNMGDHENKEMMFSDEKNFEIDGDLNKKNDRISRSRE